MRTPPGRCLRVNPGLPLWIFGCTLSSCTGFFFDDRIPARQSLAQLRSSASHPTRHHTENTEITQKHGKYKESVGWNPCSTLPRPPHGTHRNQRNSRKGGQGRKNGGSFAFKRGERISFFIWGAGGRLRRGARRGGNILFADATPAGASLRVHPQSYCAPIMCGGTAEKGRSLRGHLLSYCVSFISSGVVWKVIPLPGEQNRIYSCEILWMYFDFV